MRYLITFSYDGSKFMGYERQPNLKTVQGVIEDALYTLSLEDIRVHASGRTDKGVHAINQKAHFDMNKKIELYKIKNALNSKLNQEIYIKDINIVDDNFHARYNVLSKTYKYIINMGSFNPIEKDYVYQYNKYLDIKLMEKVSKKLIGEHDFRCFCKDEKEKINCVRNIYDIKIETMDEKLILTFTGNGFLKYMIRNIVGVLILVGSNKIKEEEIDLIMENKSKINSRKAVLPNGLYLVDVYY